MQFYFVILIKLESLLIWFESSYLEGNIVDIGRRVSCEHGTVAGGIVRHLYDVIIGHRDSAPMYTYCPSLKVLVVLKVAIMQYHAPSAL